MASVPLALALTSKACVEHEAVGECFPTLMDDDVIDERMAVMLLLILERRRGARRPRRRTSRPSPPGSAPRCTTPTTRLGVC